MTLTRLIIPFISLIFLIPLSTINNNNIVVAFASAETEIDINSDTINMRPSFPEHWGPPPIRQTRDFIQLPGEYGRGSSTLKKWIEEKMAEDETRKLDDTTTTKWPEKILVGMSGEDAKTAVLEGDSTLLEENVHILPHDAMVTMDYREDRVRIFVKDGLVVSQPIVG